MARLRVIDGGSLYGSEVAMFLPSKRGLYRDGGKKQGHIRSVQQPAVYHTEAGQEWTMPTSGGMYPTFSVGATDKEKKREVAEFINRKTHIKIAELAEELLKNQLCKAVSEEYYMELRQGVLQYNGVSTSELLEHIFCNYARIDDALIIKKRGNSKRLPTSAARSTSTSENKKSARG